MATHSSVLVKIANATEGSSERQITITGTPANISLAQYLSKNTVASCQALLQGIFLTQGSNLHLLQAPTAAGLGTHYWPALG